MKYRVLGNGEGRGFHNEQYESYQIYDGEMDRNLLVDNNNGIGTNLKFKQLEDALNMCAALNLGYLARLEEDGANLAPFQDYFPQQEVDLKRFLLVCNTCGREVDYDGPDEDEIPGWTHITENYVGEAAYKGFCPICKPPAPIKKKAVKRKAVKRKAVKKKKYVAPQDQLPKAHQEDSWVDDFPF